MTARDDFEAAWADAYPLHKEPFLRSGYDTGQYAATRVNDGWKMYMAAHERAERAAEAPSADADRWREFIKGEPESLVRCIGAYPIPPQFVPSLELVAGGRTITMEMGEVVYSVFAWVRTKEIQSVQDSIDAAIKASREALAPSAAAGEVDLFGVVPTAPPEEFTDLQGLATALMTHRAIARDELGYLSHPAMPVLDEGIDVEQFLAVFGLEVAFVSMDGDVSSESYDEYSESGDGDCSKWEPTRPGGDGWILLEIFADEDGPHAMFVRPLSPPKQERPIRSPGASA